ncbi:MAG: hypothetical protein RL701_370 [Pseudomonadota bacterium]|jgi:hypothetical protein
MRAWLCSIGYASRCSCASQTGLIDHTRPRDGGVRAVCVASRSLAVAVTRSPRADCREAALSRAPTFPSSNALQRHSAAGTLSRTFDAPRSLLEGCGARAHARFSTPDAVLSRRERHGFLYASGAFARSSARSEVEIGPDDLLPGANPIFFFDAHARARCGRQCALRVCIGIAPRRATRVSNPAAMCIRRDSWTRDRRRLHGARTFATLCVSSHGQSHQPQ